MTVLGFGLNHKTAPFALLESVCFAPDAMRRFLGTLVATDAVDEAFGLSTCNRTEFLLATSDAQAAMDLLIQLILDEKGVDLSAHADETFTRQDEAALRHLFQIACGIDSLVVGEYEILGQLRRAREAASDAGYINTVLDPLVLRAIDVGRRARQATAISRGNVSVASVGATLAMRILGDLSNKTGVVLGAGKTAEAAAFQLTERGLKDLTIVNRTYERAHQVATTLGANDAELGELSELLLKSDIMICATGAEDFVVSKPLLEQAMHQRAGQPMLLLDLSVPRNIDPDASHLPGVHLHSLQDLTQLADENRAQREAQMREVETLIEQELLTWNGLRDAASSLELIAALHRQLEQVRRDYVDKQRDHFSPEDQDDLELFSAGLTRALLHDLVQNLRDIKLDTTEGRRRYEIARELLSVGRSESAPGSPDDPN